MSLRSRRGWIYSKYLCLLSFPPSVVLLKHYRDSTFYTTNVYYDHTTFVRDPSLDSIGDNCHRKIDQLNFCNPYVSVFLRSAKLFKEAR